jgi:hypothetical protein
MKQFKVIILCIFIIISFIGCKKTQLIKTWYDNQTRNESFNKVLVVGLFENDVHRRTFEASLAYELDKTGKKVIPAYKITPKPNGLYKKETIINAVKETDAKWVIISFFKGIKNKYNKIQGEIEYRLGTIEYDDPFYNGPMGFGSYYDFVYEQVYHEGYIQVDTIIILETVVYSVEKQKPVWVGISETKNAQAAKDITADLSELIIKDMKKNKILR